MELNTINTYLQPNGKLTLLNRPLFIILFESGKSPCSIYDMDKEDKFYNNMTMFRGHYFISKDGKIFCGRPLNAIGEFANDKNRGISFNTNSVGICVEGDYGKEIMPEIQKTSLILTIQYLLNQYPDIKTIYGLDELVTNIDNPGVLFPLSEIIATATNTSTQSVRTAPNGNTRHTFTTRTLSFNSKKPVEGSDVKELQILLNLFGYKNTVSGVFDSNTLENVIDFQRSNNITPNGVVSEDTFTYIENLARKFYNTKVTFNRVLYYIESSAMYGEDVKILQTRLNLFGYKCIVNGFFDEATEDAVKGFQEVHALKIDGRVGPITWERITSGETLFIKRVLSYTVPMIFGDDVKLVQQRLNELGYEITDCNGWFDEVTKDKVIEFQKTNGLTPDGKVDNLTAKTLFK